MRSLKPGAAATSMAGNRGAWTPEEDRRLAQVIETQGPRRWKSVAVKAGLSRCGKSCRLRWMNYLRPNIKRGNISAQEEDLILRLHKLLGNRWSLIAGRLPGRTDNEIKNYWNSHLSKKAKQCQANNKHASSTDGAGNVEGTRQSASKSTVIVKHNESMMCNNEAASCSNNAKLRMEEQKQCEEDGGLSMEWVSQLLVDIDDQSWFLNYYT
uniref:Uncharacterized protein n=1 Tax=Kalanchoe fedtschenkoi TaxID=63787 RepID=A0A7N0V3H6_KALFE